MPAAVGKSSTYANQTPQIFEYICSNCNNLLKSTNTRIDKQTIKEDCPICGTALAQSLAIKPQKTTPVGKSLATTQKHPEFVRADNYPRLCYGILELDKVLSPLVEGDMLCISGSQATTLLEGLCCQSLLPPRAGGLGATQVLYIDAGNTSQIYRFARLARFYGLDYRDALKRVIQTRTFTIHQLASIVINELSAAVNSIKSKAVFVSDLFELFLREPNLNVKEGESLAAQMAQAFAKTASKCLLVISLTRASIYDRFLLSQSRHSVKQLKIVENEAQYSQSGQKQVTSLKMPAEELIVKV